ncbi:PREDICTED: myb-like protein P [Drosophila arizonae]|uniref:Myb-like protein P n=1 Tax=Drosophila arizonae TaxID=7263 RepID=A0ABM1PJC2_DROAR|nr:PREDICTED: myb-like protein P [Drosophila arizonae]
MERFAFKIDAALKANLYKICRLCGIDNPTKVPILPVESDVVDLDEPSLSQKVFELVGFTVTRNDKMPQTMCSLCVDKINDFYEFREMCYATNNQTRKLLGLKSVDPQKIVDVKPIFKSEPLTAPPPAKRGRKRKTEDAASSSNNVKSNTPDIPLDAVKNEPLSWRKKLRLQPQPQPLTASKTEIKEEPAEVKKCSIPAKKSRKAICSVCSKRFESKELAEQHKTAAHIPTILRYHCTACNQSYHSLSDIKAHQLWHKLSKTPYQCPLCDASIANNYAYSRHLREHTSPTPIELQVLDRECPLCKKTFLTNFFYNTHPCARRTRQCGGCSRPLSSELAYMRHAPHCAKIYLNHSKHIMPEASNHEAEMRIKNENDLEAEDNAQSSIAYTKQVEMQPVVVLERLGSPLLRASSAGRSADRVSSKNYLKRVDQLLKNTMNTLVSIKHEPEVHIDDTGPPLASEEPESDPNDEPPSCDDFHADAGYDDSDEDAANGSANAAAAPPADPPAESVKQEVIDESYEKQLMPSTDGVQVKQEPLKLKLKITKNHGQLNSSIVDDDNEVQSKSAKKKKKRKHKERNRDSEASDKATGSATAPEESPIEESVETAGSAIMNIKQELLDDSLASDFTPREEFEPQSTVMTSIPMLQLERNYTEESQKLLEEQEDVKPNRLELDRIMQITHIASGVVMAEEAMPLESAVEAVPQEDHVVEKPANPTKKILTKSTARKSTGGAMHRDVASSSNSLPSTVEQLPQIVAVESGASVPFNTVAIKPEPLNRGYADEEQEWTGQNETEAEQHEPNKSNEINHNDSRDDESAYINSLDLSNVIIKQEKDLHISDVNINGSEADNTHYNGLHESEDSADDENVDGDYDDGSASSADEADENMDTYEDREERIYREIELQPLDEQDAVKSPGPETENESIMPPKPQPEIATDSVPEPEDMPMETQAQEEQPRPEMQTVEPQETARTALEEQAVLETPSESEIYSGEPADMAQQSKPDQERQQNQTELPEESQMPSEAESQPHAHSEPAFNFVITNVCSQADQQPLAANEEQFEDINPEPSQMDDGINEEKSTSPVVTLSAPKDSETLAQPVYASSSNYNCAEEQQNVLNHELSATLQTAHHETESESDPSTAAVCIEALGEDVQSANEETENRINEQQQQQLEQVQQEPMQQQPPRVALDDDLNINEIAENNNNANIERELNDDANVAQENPME